MQYMTSDCDSHVDSFKHVSQNATSVDAHDEPHVFTSTRHNHNLCIETGKTGDNPERIVLVAASNGSNASNFPIKDLPNAYIFQVGYHQAYGLTGALSDDQNGYPQGYRHGDLEIAEFFE
eukprot:6927558-Karenia_brevis.AAC.1